VVAGLVPAFSHMVALRGRALLHWQPPCYSVHDPSEPLQAGNIPHEAM